MTAIVGKIADGFDGVLVVTPDFPFVDNNQTPTPALVISPFEANITNGVFAIEIPQSENVSKGTNDPSDIRESVTYKWEVFEVIKKEEFYFPNGDSYGGVTNFTNGKYYTGVNYDAQDSRELGKVERSERKSIFAIHAVCPDSTNLPNPQVNFTDLAGVPIQGNWLGIGLRRLADLLTSDPYLGKIAQGFNLKGDYAPALTYNQRDLVSFQGSAWVWVDQVSGNNQPPSTSWQLIAEKGKTGTGTTATIAGYDPTAWKGSDQAASQADIVQALSGISTVDPQDYYTKEQAAPINNPAFTGVARRLTYPGNQDNEIATLKWVNDALGKAKLDYLPDPLFYGSRGISQSLRSGQQQKVFWNSAPINAGVWGGTGEITIPEDGYYLFFMSLSFKVNGNFSSNTRRSILKGWLADGTTKVGNLFYLDTGSANLTWIRVLQGWQFKSLTSGQKLTFQVSISGIGQSGGSINASPNNNFALMWRVK